MSRLLTAVLLLFLLTGCGYQLGGTVLNLPDNVSTVTIEMFDNKTMEPYLENILTTQVTRRLMLLPDIDLVENAVAAEAALSGVITDYRVESFAYDSQNRVALYRATMQVEAVFRRQSDGRILWRGDFIRFQTFSADPDLKRQADLERIAQETLSSRLSEDISFKLTETF